MRAIKAKSKFRIVYRAAGCGCPAKESMSHRFRLRCTSQTGVGLDLLTFQDKTVKCWAPVILEACAGVRKFSLLAAATKKNPILLRSSARTERVSHARHRTSHPAKRADKKKVKDKTVEDEIPTPSLKNLKKGDIRRFFGQAYQQRWPIGGAVGLLLISSTVTMAIPFSVGKVIDLVSKAGEGTKETLRNIAAILVVVFLIGAAANFGRVYLFQTTSARLIADLRNKLYTSLMVKDMTYYDNQKTGELVNRLSNDVWTVGDALTQNISDGLRSLLSSVTGIGMMFYVSADLAMVGLVTVPPIAALGIVYGRFLKKITEKILDAWADSTQVATERLGNMRTVHAFNQHQKEIDLYDKSILQMLGLQYKEANAKAAFFGMAGLTGNMVVLSVLYYGGILMSRGDVTVGDLSAFLLYAGYVGVSIAGLSSFYSEMMRGIGASTKIWEIMDRPPRILLESGVIPSTPLRAALKFQNVDFNYGSRKEVPVLQELTLDIPEGSFTAFVGPSGSGKSTIISLLLRLYDPDKGSVYLDGVDVKTLSPKWLRSNIGYVPQDVHLFSCSVYDNIVYGGSGDISMEQVVDACKKANAYDFIMAMPQQFETVVGERGLLLSGGQRQRISIARALVKNPKILLLDEATSSLDSESESLVQSALKELMKGRTVVSVAHRLSTIRNADQICVLDQGRIVERGTYSDLLTDEEGAFKKLIQRQMLSIT
ncbi:ATP-binding cassette sub-family B member 10, mitochondrial [Hypsibius exemplaris]|uniref:ATP-binding cassette sub-family B member 10, mitochondrial n=1 Tax=Hypsibius exemplaris TaxID=2072580 RepID=A0A1W0XFI6_HYPEX|nr:ATP-binding cassette sub-family B member 10, mitochondrial [Hypsibius exemplaris]